MTDPETFQEFALNPDMGGLSNSDLVERVTGHGTSFDVARSFADWTRQVGPQGAMAMLATVELVRREREAPRG